MLIPRNFQVRQRCIITEESMDGTTSAMNGKSMCTQGVHHQQYEHTGHTVAVPREISNIPKKNKGFLDIKMNTETLPPMVS